jgi:hypothetical protein
MNRREFMKLSALTAGAVIGEGLMPDYGRLANASPSPLPDGTISDEQVKSMDFEIIFDTEIINPPKDDEPVSIWMPLSQSCFEQDITDLTVKSPVAFHINEEPHHRNKMLYVGPARLKRGDRITVKYRIHRKAVNIIESDDDINKHLVLANKERGNENIYEFADKAAGSEKDPVETGRKIYYALMDFMTYDMKSVGCGPGISILAFENRTGRCADLQSLFRAMMMHRGIPVRWEQGILLPYPSEKIWHGELEGDCIGTLCWTEFHIGGNKWLPVDMVEGSQKKGMKDYFFGHLSANRFNTSTGRDIMLSPAQAGDPLNTFPVTYAEYDGIPLIYGHHYRNNVGYEVLNLEM